MDSKPLDLFVEENGQTEAGRLLGVSAPAISKALSAKRDITVSANPDGSFTARETRLFPSRAADQRSRSQVPPTLNTNLRPLSAFGQSPEGAGDSSSIGQA